MAGYLAGMVQQRRGDEERMAGEEQASGREFRDSPMEQQHVGRDAPTSQVGYGGGNRTAEYAHYPPAGDAESILERDDNLGEGKAHGGRFVGGHGSSEPRLSEDQPVSNPQGLGLPDFGGSTGRPESDYSSTDRNVAPPAAESGSYGMADANAKPSESGYGRSGPGGYAGEGGAHRSSSSEYDTTDANAKPSDAGYGSSGPGEHAGEGGAHRSSQCGTADPNAKPSDSGYGSSGPGGYAGEGGLKVSEGQDTSKYGTCDGNAFPSEAGSGMSSPGGYAGEGGARRDGEPSVPVTHKSQHVQDSSQSYGLPTPVRPPGAVLLDEQHFDGPKYGRDTVPSTTGDGGYASQPVSLNSGSLQESEVRAGVPHGVMSGHPSGAGQNNYGTGEVGKAPLSTPIGHQGVKPQEYHQTGSLASHGGSAYSQQYTQPDEPDTRFSELQGIDQPSTKPSPTETTNMTPAAGTVKTHHEEGFMAKLKSHLPGHKQQHAHTNVDTKHADSTTPGTEHEKPSFMEKIKDKLSPGHHKQANEQ
ncbi:hypothetical protein Mapa_016810 [Marchantia paleacea]|nr:hypothetical protein Mapa_016810 [Marchantia paleacea]